MWSSLGRGHVGLPLGLAFAERGLKVALFDLNSDAVDQVENGVMLFAEEGADEVLHRVVGKRLIVNVDPDVVASAENVIIVIGTPVDEHLNPDPNAVSEAVGQMGDSLRTASCWCCARPSIPGPRPSSKRRSWNSANRSTSHSVLNASQKERR